MKFFSKLYNIIYWKVKARTYDSVVESYSLNRKTVLEGKNIIREGVSTGKNVKIGKYSYLSGPNTTINSAIVGRFCSIAMGVKIGLDEHDYTSVTTHPFVYSKKFGGFVSSNSSTQEKKAPIIGHDVWIGVNAVISRGVSIGNGAVIGAGAIVTKDVKPYSIVVGVPAKCIGYRFSDDDIVNIERIKWWDWDDNRIKNHLNKFKDLRAFLKDVV